MASREEFKYLTDGILVCSDCGYEAFCHMETWGYPSLTGKCPECKGRFLSWEPGV